MSSGLEAQENASRKKRDLIRVSYAAVASSAGSLKGVPPMWDSVLIAISGKTFVIRGLWTTMLGYIKKSRFELLWSWII